jgi:trehalose-6-phosphatase
VRKALALHPDFDFILCVGDDRTDEGTRSLSLSLSLARSSRGLISFSRLTTHLSLSLSPDMFCALDTMVREDEDKMIYTCTVGRYTYE